MKFLPFTFLLFLPISVFSQALQLHYDFRHSTDPKLNTANYPTFYFEYFKNVDTLGTGSFLFKLQTDLNGKNNNIGQCFTQISQSLKYWKPKLYIYLTYSGGLGVTPTSFGFYIPNSFAAGASGLLVWKGVWISPSLSLRVNMFDKPSYDPQVTLYVGRGFFNYKLFASGSFTFWTENRNQGNDATNDLRGKKFAFFGDPQIWIKIKNNVSVGSKVNVLYNLTGERQMKFYPTVGIKYQF